MKTTIKIISLIIFLASLQSCELFKKNIAPAILFDDWVGDWSNIDPAESFYHKLSLQLKKNKGGANNLFMSYTSDDGKVGKEIEAQIEQLDGSDPQNVGFKDTKVIFLEEFNFGAVKFIKYSTRIREADKRLFVEISYLKEDMSLYDPIIWKTKNLEFLLD